jgi:acyl-CoA dehydrogenase
VEAGWGFILNRYGTERLREEVLHDVVKGNNFLGIASTEATGGSDIASTSTIMERKGNKLALNGAKTYISGVREAAQYGGGFATIVRTKRGGGHKGLSLCYLPVKGTKGVTTGFLKQMGREGISNGFIKINNAEIPDYHLIGEWDRGFYYAMEGFNCARTLVSAACVGAAERALETGADYIRKRKVFNTPLAKFEGIQFQLAEDYAKLEAARLIVYKAAWMLDRMYSGGAVTAQEINKAVATAKLTAPTTAFDIIRDVMIWHGAYGYTKDAGLERGLRGVTSYLVGAEGAQNIMKIIIGREILGKEFSPF